MIRIFNIVVISVPIPRVTPIELENTNAMEYRETRIGTKKRNSRKT